MNKIKLTKEQKFAIEILDIPEDIDAEKWVYVYQIIKHTIKPSHARAVLETVGIIADAGVPIERILNLLKEKYFEME